MNGLAMFGWMMFFLVLGMGLGYVIGRIDSGKN